MIRDFMRCVRTFCIIRQRRSGIRRQSGERAVAVTIPAVYEGLPEEYLHTYVGKWWQNLCVVPFHAKDDFKRLRGGRTAGAGTHFRLGHVRRGKESRIHMHLQETMRILNLKPEELLMVDDLKPGYDMAKACGVPFACAGWSDNQIPVVREYMQNTVIIILRRQQN